ncbi:Signal transduction histidine kinase [Parapedobacter luteus]|uniref:histidine kinase n=1 Tax=Parapedobacter luteus TaxID=623280 RepID=A0A1T5CDF1_9SPHI|nr:response regulator [Parapedobacter luteus]SKB57505.1 Signal transduction histidine kinase [Parapedobacter luteus]
MKKLKFKTHIYLGFSVLVILLLASLLHVSLLFSKLDAAHTILDHIKTTFLVTAVLVFIVILWLLVYVTKTFEHYKKTERLIRKSNADLNKLSKEKEVDNWALNGLATLDDNTRGGLSERVIAVNAIQTICQYLDAKVGVIYLKSEADDNEYLHGGSYAVPTEHIRPKITKSQGLMGESIASKKQVVLTDIPDGYLTVTSALGETKPKHIVIQPFVYEDEVIGVMEIGFFHKIESAVEHFLIRAGVDLAVALKVSRTHAALTHLVEETRQQAEELAAQREILRTTNEELTHKTYLLEASEEELRVQQEELKHANTELEEKARLLEERNFSIEQARQSIAMKAKELEQSGQYKTEFMANMSHELRTPLNSILILAKLLEDNKSGNLLPEQVRYATVIHRAGTDLLQLINNILDLAKIESGSVELIIERIECSSIAQDLLDLFGSIADSKTIDFFITINDGLPPFITTDEQRLKQILKNLLSNAFKFTPEGGQVTLSFALASQSPAWKTGMLRGIRANDALAISVIDNGIGIAEDKQQLIFEAFKQADGSISRKFGGTGLGLSICRELATMLGGELHVSSIEQRGSTFTLFIPLRYTGSALLTSAKEEQGVFPLPPNDAKYGKKPEPSASSAIAKPRRLLIVEDDQHFADLLALCAREHGFEPLVANEGPIGLQMAFDHVPDAIILDILLPVMDGWTVLRKLKDNPDTKDIPVHLMSADKSSKRKIEDETVGFLTKPADKRSLEALFALLDKTLMPPVKKVLIVEDQIVQSDSLKSTLTAKGVEVEQAFTGADALELLQSDIHYDCIILDINLPDRSGIEVLDDIRHTAKHAQTPVVINTAMELNAEMTGRIMRHTKTLVMKSDQSGHRILDEIDLFINNVKNNPAHNKPSNGQGSPAQRTPQVDKILQGKRILLADDDMRNIFALSTVFSSCGLEIETANNGLEVLQAIQKQSHIDLILMDIMMPEMDGFEAITKIRSFKKFAKLPIIAMTAKAMPGDRQRALDAGANDYITKPVDANRLLSLMRVWLS